MCKCDLDRGRFGMAELIVSDCTAEKDVGKMIEKQRWKDSMKEILK